MLIELEFCYLILVFGVVIIFLYFLTFYLVHSIIPFFHSIIVIIINIVMMFDLIRNLFFSLLSILIIGMKMIISKSKIRNRIAIMKNWFENGINDDIFWLNPHSNLDVILLFLFRFFFTVNIIVIKIIIIIVVVINIVVVFIGLFILFNLFTLLLNYYNKLRTYFSFFDFNLIISLFKILSCDLEEL